MDGDDKFPHRESLPNLKAQGLPVLPPPFHSKSEVVLNLDSDSNKSAPDAATNGGNGVRIVPPAPAAEIQSVSDGDKVSDNPVKNQSKKNKPKKKRNLWSVKITVISLFLSAFISFLSEMTASSEYMIVTVLLLFFLILASILFDGIGVAVTSCDITPIMAMASKKIYGAKTAMWLLKNNEKVANVCNDVIGDIFGIISGACTAAIAAKIVLTLDVSWQKWLTIGISSLVAALTIGGKAFLKNVAISNSKEFVMFVSRIIAIFSPEERRRKKKQNEQRKKYFEENKAKQDKGVGIMGKSGKTKKRTDIASRDIAEGEEKQLKKTSKSKRLDDDNIDETR